jgi:hypothetical protein
MRAGRRSRILRGMGQSGARGGWGGAAIVLVVVAVVVVWDPLGGVVRTIAEAVPDPPWLGGLDLPQPLRFLLGPGKLLLLVAALVLADALRRRRRRDAR